MRSTPPGPARRSPWRAVADVALPPEDALESVEHTGFFPQVQREEAELSEQDALLRKEACWTTCEARL